MKFFTQWKQRQTLFKAVDILISAEAGLWLMNIYVLTLKDVERINPIRLEIALDIWLLAWLELHRRNGLFGNQGTPLSFGLFELLSPVFEPHEDAIQSIVDDLSNTWNEDEGKEETDETVEANYFVSRIDTAIQSAQESLRPLFAELDALADELGLPFRYSANRKKASRYFEKDFHKVVLGWIG
jgi:hypothetical protein